MKVIWVAVDGHQFTPAVAALGTKPELLPWQLPGR